MKKGSQNRYLGYPANGGFQYGAKGRQQWKRQAVICCHLRMVALVFGLMGGLFLLDSLMLIVLHPFTSRHGLARSKLRWIQDRSNKYIEEETTEMVMYDQKGLSKYTNIEKTEKTMYARLLSLASSPTMKNEFQSDPFALWEEPHKQASMWKPCADRHNLIHQGTRYAMKPSGYILVSANGGLNQQRVAVCNAVVVAALLNATLVLPNFLYNSVWKDSSQFGDIYQEEYFINFLKDDVKIVKELPPHLQLLDIEAIGSQITDMDIMKESEPVDFVKVVLPLLERNGIVHFLGFGNRLAFDPLPSDLQRLRCKCNFHALKFVPRIQQISSLLVGRIRKYGSRLKNLDNQLLGNYMPHHPVNGQNISRGPSKYLALHMRFEMDMVAYSLCDFGGREKERNELQGYREIHFPTLLTRMRSNESVSPAELRISGKCPLTPEEAALMLSALGFRRETYIYLAGSHIYGGQSRMLPFIELYPNVVTKEDLLNTK